MKRFLYIMKRDKKPIPLHQRMVASAYKKSLQSEKCLALKAG